MGMLVIRQAGQKDRVYRIRRERVLIGRDQRAQLVLPNVSVSRRHAYIITQGVRCVLVDLESTNGVEVNGERSSRQVLRHGDQLRIGRYRLEYYQEQRVDPLMAVHLASMNSASTSSMPDDMKTVFVPAEVREAILRSERARLQATLVRGDGGSGRWHPEAQRLTIGPGGDVPVELAFARRPVAEITWDGANHVIRALCWPSRVEVDGERIKEVVLSPGAEIRVGQARFDFVHDRARTETLLSTTRSGGVQPEPSAIDTLPIEFVELPRSQRCRGRKMA